MKHTVLAGIFYFLFSQFSLAESLQYTKIYDCKNENLYRSIVADLTKDLQLGYERLQKEIRAYRCVLRQRTVKIVQSVESTYTIESFTFSRASKKRGMVFYEETGFQVQITLPIVATQKGV